ncbi:hypothetical protein SAMD00019534_092210 [Acytostelium subglobosum LB1]|uniref:hypothetical protein n=1 Tax=Acytostelium subglobosum LB1 TaxID=1410327 RepID=UPI000644D60E|nr:hypothetical protein SAMD00019534_092210 [Acytostelium subglobosum LB1]GAM26046.1 hypothetical protein SAMD00019534_092210 [Acytostelium subglobosum LB1]|eukprot:XP_012751089.1 hypothetical protein SAMD00019534_092210 [Acytostelium subglobosum LB1]
MLDLYSAAIAQHFGNDTGSSSDHTCKTSFATGDVVLGILLAVGIFISFLPQIFVLILRKNVEGLSVISCWFNFANCMGTFLNSLFLNWFVFTCCSNFLTSWTCFENFIPVVQMAVPFVVTGVIFALYVVYRPKLPPLSSVNQSSNGSPTSPAPEHEKAPLIDNDVEQQKDGKGVLPADSFLLKEGNNKIERFFIRMDWYSLPFFWGSIAFTIIFFAIGVALIYSYGDISNVVKGYAYGLGILASVLVFFQWIPQIYTTWIADEIGSLSLSTLLIQIPGAILICFNQLSLHQSWTTWFPYLATAVQEIILVGICLYYIIRDYRKKKQGLLPVPQSEEEADAQQQQQQQQQPIDSMGPDHIINK